MIIAVDFDGTVVDHRYPDVGPDVPNAVRVLERVQKAGHNIILYTMRDGKELEDAKKWFKSKGLNLYGVNTNPTQTDWTQSPKCYAEMYIDDAAFGIPMVMIPSYRRACVDWKEIEKNFEKRYLIQ